MVSLLPAGTPESLVRAMARSDSSDPPAFVLSNAHISSGARAVWRLSNVVYHPEKKRVLAIWSNNERPRSQAFAFFPSLLCPNEPGVLDAIGRLLIRGLRLEPVGRVLRVTAPSLVILETVAGALSGNPSVLWLSPERQFLIEKNWHIGQWFDDDLLPAGVDAFSRPLAHFEAGQNPSDAFFSYWLQAPSSQIPPTEFERLEMWLANRFFEHVLLPSRVRAVPGRKSIDPTLDWSRLWRLAFGGGLNPGFESINCECCRNPPVFLLPSSMAVVEFHQDGVFFVSQFEWFRQFFHQSQPEASSRSRFMAEQGLDFLPSGPFFRNQPAIVPLADAHVLHKHGLARIAGIPEPHHFCQKPSFLVRNVQALERLEREWVRRLIGIETRAFGVDRLGGFARLEKDPDYQFLSRIVELGEEFLSGLFSHVMDPKSRFFSIELASALSAHHELWQPLWTHAAREGLNHPQVGSEALLAMVRSGPVSVTS